MTSSDAKICSTLERVTGLLVEVNDVDQLRQLAQHGALMTAEASLACRNLVDTCRAILALLRAGLIAEATALAADVAARDDEGQAERAGQDGLEDMRPRGRA
jgi:hypothetical protein